MNQNQIKQKYIINYINVNMFTNFHLKFTKINNDNANYV